MRLPRRDSTSKLPKRRTSDHIPARCGPATCGNCSGSTPESFTVTLADIALPLVHGLQAQVLAGEYCLKQYSPCYWAFLDCDTDDVEFDNAFPNPRNRFAIGLIASVSGYFWLQVAFRAVDDGGSGYLYLLFDGVVAIPNCTDSQEIINSYMEFPPDFPPVTPTGTASIVANVGDPPVGCGGDLPNCEIAPPTAETDHCYAFYFASITCGGSWAIIQTIIVSADNMPRHFTLNEWRITQYEGSCQAVYIKDLGAVADEFGECDPEEDTGADPTLPDEEDCECGDCPEDCDECCDTMDIAVTGVGTLSMGRGSCEWAGEGSTVSCSGGVWTFEITEPGFESTYTSPVSGPCPSDDPADWTQTSGTTRAITSIVFSDCPP